MSFRHFSYGRFRSVRAEVSTAPAFGGFEPRMNNAARRTDVRLGDKPQMSFEQAAQSCR